MAKKATKQVTELEGELALLMGSTDSFATSAISEQRAEALEYYLGETYGDEVAGRSDIVTREVYDAVEWIKPELMRIFCSGDRVVEFVPINDLDIASAEQDTDYINHVVMEQNPGFSNFLTWFTDGLLGKTGIAKWYWDDSFNTTEEEYENLSYEQARFVEENNPDYSLSSFEEHVDAQDGVTVVGTKAVFTVRTSKPQARWVIIPPEDFTISTDAGIKEATFVDHRKRVTRSECLEMGFTEKQLAESMFSATGANNTSPENTARYSMEVYEQSSSGDPSQDVAWLHESYWKSDVDGDGKAELIKVFSIDGKILEWEHAQEKPFAACTPLPMSHKFYGLSFFDILKDLQRTKSTLTRTMLDSAQFMNHQRMGVVDGQVNIDDLVHSRPGGVVRLKSPNALVPIQSAPMAPETFQLMDYLDTLGESRSGVSRSSQGLDPNTLRSNVAASSVNATMTAAMQKRDLIARIIAETGVKELFIGIHGLIRRHAKEADYVRLRGTYTKVDPTTWRDRMTLLVKVGLGNGSRDQQQASFMQMTSLMQMLGAAFPHLITEENAYAWIMEGFKLNGYKAADRFVTDPAKAEPAPPVPDPKMVEIQQKTAIAQQKLQQDGQLKMTALQETARHNQETEQIDQAELIRKTMADEEKAALDRAEYHLEKTQSRPVSLGRS
jgi:hypothetical protein